MLVNGILEGGWNRVLREYMGVLRLTDSSSDVYFPLYCNVLKRLLSESLFS